MTFCDMTRAEEMVENGHDFFSSADLTSQKPTFSWAHGSPPSLVSPSHSMPQPMGDLQRPSPGPSPGTWPGPEPRFSSTIPPVPAGDVFLPDPSVECQLWKIWGFHSHGKIRSFFRWMIYFMECLIKILDDLFRGIPPF